MRNLLSLVASAAIVVGLGFSVSASGQDKVERPMDTENRVDPGEQGQGRSTREAAIRRDAEALAANRGISVGEAIKAVRSQDDIGGRSTASVGSSAAGSQASTSPMSPNTKWWFDSKVRRRPIGGC